MYTRVYWRIFLLHTSIYCNCVLWSILAYKIKQNTPAVDICSAPGYSLSLCIVYFAANPRLYWRPLLTGRLLKELVFLQCSLQCVGLSDLHLDPWLDWSAWASSFIWCTVLHFSHLALQYWAALHCMIAQYLLQYCVKQFVCFALRPLGILLVSRRAPSS